MLPFPGGTSSDKVNRKLNYEKKKKSLEKSLCNFETKKMLTNLVPLNLILDVYGHIRERIVEL